MADEIDAGRLVAEIVLETKQARENAEEIKEKLDQIGSKTVNPKISDESISKVNDKLGKTEKAVKQAETASERLKRSIAEQEQKLNSLKQSYSDIVLEQGKSSDEAKKLSQKISDLSDELNHNRTKLEESTYKSNDLDKAIENTGKTAKNTGDGFTVMKGAISNLVSDALNVAIDKFKEMSVSADRSLNSLQAKTGMSAEAVNGLKTEMLDLYKNNYGDSLTDVADKMALVTQNIDESDPQKIKDITQNAIALSDTFGSDFEENLRGVNALMTNMGLTADEAFDFIAKGSQNGLDKSHELTDNLAEYSQLWGQAGFSAEEMFSILQNGLDSGAYSLDKVNDLVGEMSRSIIDGRLEQNIESFSDSTAQIFNSFKNGKATQKEVFDSMINDLNTTTGLAENLGKASDTWSALGEDNSMAVITALNNVNNTYKDVEGTMQKINDIQYDDVGNQIQALGRKFEIDILQPMVNSAAPAIETLINNFDKLLPVIVLVTTATLGYKAAINIQSVTDTVSAALGKLKAAKAADIAVTEVQTATQKANNAAVAANPYILAASAILAIVSALGTWIATSKNSTLATDNATASIKNYTQAIDEAKAAAEDKENKAQGEIAVLRTLKDEYDELRNKTNLSAEEQKRLNNVASEIAKTMGTTTEALKDQSGAYIELTGSVDDYISKLETQNRIENSKEVMKSAQKVLDETEEKYKSVAAEYERVRGLVKTTSGDWTGQVLTKENIASIPKDYYDDGDIEKGIKRLNELANTWANLSIQRSNAQETYDEYSEKLKKAMGEYNGTLSETNDKSSESVKTIEELTDSLSELSSSYQSAAENGELDSDTLKSLMEKYPELADYVSQTGDLTLANGKKIKEVYEKERQALIKKLTAKKQELELEQKDSDKKDEIAKQLAQINAELEIYTNTKIDNVDWSSTASEIKSLASAYQTLNEGKQLDVDTMIQLIDKYPEVASAMANEGKLGKEQANVFKQLFEAKKNDYILTQKRTIANLQASADETKGVIKNIQSQIEAYKNLNQLKGVFSAISYAITASLNSTLAKNQQEYNKIQQNIKQAEARIKAIKNLSADTYGNSSGGSSSTSNTALTNELKRLEHKKALGQLTSKQEYNWLVRINNRYRKNTDEQMDMEKRLYNAKKQMHADEEAANTKALQAAYKGIENKKSLGKMTSQQELRQLEQIRQKYKMTADERMELEIKIYNLKKSLKDEEISSINTLADVVTEALKEKYEQQRKIEEERINDSIKNWQDWEDKTVEAIQGEINALDELADKQESENKRQEYENKRQQTELQLAYEKDDYNRTQLQKELARLDKEEAERLAEEQREAKKKVLEGRIEAVKGQSQATQERLNKELDKLGERYEKLTDSFSLKAQAQKIIINSTQKDIVNLIKSYAPEYELAGNTVGDALYNGIKSKTNNIISYIEGIVKKFEAYQRRVANTANAAADRFWANQNSQANQKQSPSPKTVTVQQTVNFNKPVESPVETRRQLDRTNQALAKQISSGI